MTRPQALHSARRTGTAVADKASGLVVPFSEQEIDGVLERGRGAVVVFGRDEHETVGRADLRGPGLGVVFLVLPHRWGDVFVQQRQLEVGDIDQLEDGVVARHGDPVHPLRHLQRLAPWPRASNDHCNVDHGVLLLPARHWTTASSGSRPPALASRKL